MVSHRQSRNAAFVNDDDYPDGVNRLQCKTCPYQFILDKRYFERRIVKRKLVEDVMGGAGAWDNVDQTQGMYQKFTQEVLVVAEVEVAQCPAQDCEGDKAFFYMVQIRSADEPMTTFYKVARRLLS
ncbi:MAG: RNA polymerase III C11 subunit [Geoglossum umbratile]|nr:MAG: RNA polymerase III C11 subunit [Geoglossum umbratile]